MAKKPPSAIQTIISLAQSQLGVPYLYGGTSWGKGLDCSSLVQLAYAKAGIPLSRTTFTQVAEGNPVASKADLRPGDIVFFVGSDGTFNHPGHEALYVGNGKVIVAPHTGDVVKYENLDDISGYVTARRIIPQGAPSLHDVGRTIAPVVPNVVDPKTGKVSTGKPSQPKHEGLRQVPKALLHDIFAPPPAPKHFGSLVKPFVHVDAPEGIKSPLVPQALQSAFSHVQDSASGLRNDAFAHALLGASGTPVPRSLTDQFHAGSLVTAGQAQPHDLAFFGKTQPSHVGVSVGNNQFLHGTDNGTVLRVSSLTDPHYASSLLAVKRY